MEQFVKMCREIGAMPDYVQGGGGNASCKTDGNIMAIKASGFALKDITETSGYVNVDYLKIKEYHKDVSESEKKKREEEASAFNLKCTIPSAERKTLRPSVETGFHSIMKKYVMHTHPVYTNVLTCAQGGKKKAKEIFEGTCFVWAPYMNPGFMLTLAISDAISKFEKKNGEYPKVIFLENHGLVTTSDDPDECLRLHIKTNETIKSKLGLSDFYQDLKLQKAGDGYKSSAPFIGEFLSKYGMNTMMSMALYPDQLVYLYNGLKDGKISFENGTMFFKTGENEARAILETFAAVVYIIESLHKLNIPVHPMHYIARDFINNWESEKYRRKVTAK